VFAITSTISDLGAVICTAVVARVPDYLGSRGESTWSFASSYAAPVSGDRVDEGTTSMRHVTSEGATFLSRVITGDER
jgi:hypothetical protein